jgi:cell division septal protein FtsQ
MSSVAAPADRRFRRAHLKPGKRRRVWRAFVRPVVQYGVLGAALVYGLYRMASVAAYAHVLRIDNINVAGTERLSRGEVMSLLNGMRGESILWTNLDAWRRNLMTSPWVVDASLRRSLPATIDVVVTERQPMGIGRINGDMYLVDATGMVIDQYGPQYADLDLPIVDGLSPRHAKNGSAPETMIDPTRADLAARVISALRTKPAVAKRLSQVDVADVHNAAVILTGEPAVIQIGEDQFLARIESYLELASAVHERVTDIDYVDLRFDDRIYVRPTKSGQDAMLKLARVERAKAAVTVRAAKRGRGADQKR